MVFEEILTDTGTDGHTTTDIMWSQQLTMNTLCSSELTIIKSISYFEAVKMAEEFVAMALIGLVWALISAICAHVSTFQSLR